jgi:ATP-dependent DNA helicase RecG
MHRLVQGEVGSGKTLVALRAMLAVADSGGQAALLAPTEVLAAQHLRSIVKMLGPEISAQVVPTLVTGQLPAAERRKALLRAAAGQARIVIGTHALLGDRVSFADLGLVVVDEQHRFGVEQREALRLKGEQPHVLVLTATPIPRTVAMTVFGDLDVSTIHELPAGRAGIETHVVPLSVRPGWRPRVWSRLVEELELGRQGFVVCPAIDPKAVEDDGEPPMSADPGTEGEPAGPRPGGSVVEVLAELQAHPGLAGRRVEPLHGRMSADEKDAVMRAFAAGEIDVLVATTVIEVGVDVPNASAMVVIDADRFGVSQLHQLRGRVGRGSVPGLCLLVTHADPGSVALERVEAVAATLDGFELAQVDLELRREGDVLGSTQSGGRSSLKLLRVARDGDVIAEARAAAATLLDDGPGLREHAALAAAVRRRLDDEASEFLSKG